MNNILLSISMLISGRDEMKQSLESLMCFKKAFPTEIVLVDTGCNEEQRKLAEQYADKIVPFTWCNDFAKARNAGLKEVHGEWFMYLDDDEWFDNPQEIIYFFTSKEYRNYNSATYCVRSYTNKEGTLYEDGQVSRMVRIQKETCFQGKIHEYLVPFDLPQKTFKDFAHHYGYVFQSVEEKKKHSQRNIKPLLEMVEENPGNIRWMVQLAQEYFSVGELDKVIEICQKGIDFWNVHRTESIPFPPEIGCAYAFILASYERKKDFIAAEQWLDRAIKEPHIPEVVMAFFCMSGIRIFGKKNVHDRCTFFTKEYLTYYFKLKDNMTVIDRDTFLLTECVFQRQLAFPSLLISIPSLIYEEKLEILKRAFSTIEWNDPRMLHQMEYEQKMVEACCSVPYNSLWKTMLQTLVSRPDGMKEMYSVFLKLEVLFKGKNAEEKISRLYRLVSELDYPHKYILYTKILWVDKDPDIHSEEERQDTLTKLFTRLFEEYPKDILDIKAEVWDVAENRKINVGSMLERIKFATWTHDLDNWILEAPLEKIQEWQGRIQIWKQSEDSRYKVFQIKYLEGTLRNCKPPFYGMSEVERLFWQCSDAILDLYSPCYTESAFTQTPELLPDEIQFALQLRTLRQAREQGSDRDVLEALRALNDTYEPMNGVVAYYAKLYRDEIHNRNDEMAKLAAGLKKNVRILINAGKLDDAKNVITQLEQFIPDDEELQAFKEELQMN